MKLKDQSMKITTQQINYQTKGNEKTLKTESVTFERQKGTKEKSTQQVKVTLEQEKNLLITHGFCPLKCDQILSVDCRKVL